MSWAQYSGYFTYKFWGDHVYEGTGQAKKDAEQVFQRRDVAVSSVLQMDSHSIHCLVGEIKNRQEEYTNNPQAIFTSEKSFAYWERSGKRAKQKGPAQFRYAVRNEEGVFKIHHFDGVV